PQAPSLVATTLRLRPSAARRTIPPVLGAIGLLAAGTLAFVAARALGGAPQPEVPHGIVPPATPMTAPPERGAASALRPLHVVSEPPGAAIAIDGIDIAAQTPAVVAVDPRIPVIYVGVSLEGYGPESREVSSSIREARFVLSPTAIDAGIAADPEPPPRRRRGRRRTR
nr:hypothetical protein [Myxococcota bacterium]